MIRMGNPNPLLSAAFYGLDLEHCNDSNSNTINLKDSVATYKSIKCWYTNADSLSSKFNELQSRLTIDKPDIVVITEINCNFGGSNTEFNIDRYKTKQNTINSQQRGVCIFVKSDLQAYKDDALSSS